MRLYDWNIAASAAFFADLHRFEVVLRNALHSHAARVFSENWFDRPDLLTERGRADVNKVKTRIRGPISSDAIVSELSFGFWRYLLSHRYEQTLWTPALRHGFPHLHPQARKEVERRVKYLNELRNRIAHCEPILRRDLEQDRNDLLLVVGWICPEARSWIESTSVVRQCLQARPGRLWTKR
ncbi:hypothetical protein [Natronoglycomyces albus]|uniref:Abi-like protein n=1 Tax=Natronoglycomyces albus TaxID=2811108 RepID=A0A895XIL2_9ACTN|nr:hypothetical protein [Natronoglycomyces albus]QSB04797.1 hypothetical protein JQS30_13645 [Natronoglycomyces albus]